MGTPRTIISAKDAKSKSIREEEEMGGHGEPTDDDTEGSSSEDVTDGIKLSMVSCAAETTEMC